MYGGPITDELLMCVVYAASVLFFDYVYYFCRLISFLVARPFDSGQFTPLSGTPLPSTAVFVIFHLVLFS